MIMNNELLFVLEAIICIKLQPLKVSNEHLRLMVAPAFHTMTCSAVCCDRDDLSENLNLEVRTIPSPFSFCIYNSIEYSIFYSQT